ncbi:MAG: AbrB/MazE/SpoVT family DNA-binding domain-containing protein [Chloroflexi bacterium]|nr:AbrB/MazE/SpoVT family DNA-binding domain-containing protein [Chloroflexota bacterium]
MATIVGTKGQVVIEKQIRERLGLEPGSLAIQRLVGDHVEIYFGPPAHRRSLRGILASRIQRHVSPEEWEMVREEAWAEAAREELDNPLKDERTRHRKQSE